MYESVADGVLPPGDRDACDGRCRRSRARTRAGRNSAGVGVAASGEDPVFLGNGLIEADFYHPTTAGG